MGSEVPGNMALIGWPLSNVFLSSLHIYPWKMHVLGTCPSLIRLLSRSFEELIN